MCWFSLKECVSFVEIVLQFLWLLDECLLSPKLLARHEDWEKDRVTRVKLLGFQRCLSLIFQLFGAAMDSGIVHCFFFF